MYTHLCILWKFNGEVEKVAWSQYVVEIILSAGDQDM